MKTTFRTILTLAIVAILAYYVTPASAFTITGRVVDSEDHAPIKGPGWAYLYEKGNDLDMYYDELNTKKVRFEVDEPGIYVLKLACNNYVPARAIRIEVTGEDSTVDFGTKKLVPFRFFFYDINSVNWLDAETGAQGVEISAKVHNRLPYNIEPVPVYVWTMARGAKYAKKTGWIMSEVTSEPTKLIEGESVNFTFALPPEAADGICWDVYLLAGRSVFDPVTDMTYSGATICLNNGQTTVQRRKTAVNAGK